MFFKYPEFLKWSNAQIFLRLQHICLNNLIVTGCSEEITYRQWTCRHIHDCAKRIQQQNSDISVVVTCSPGYSFVPVRVRVQLTEKHCTRKPPERGIQQVQIYNGSFVILLIYFLRATSIFILKGSLVMLVFGHTTRRHTPDDGYFEGEEIVTYFRTLRTVSNISLVSWTHHLR
jgi:hypothetical protein